MVPLWQQLLIIFGTMAALTVVISIILAIVNSSKHAELIKGIAVFLFIVYLIGGTLYALINARENAIYDTLDPRNDEEWEVRRY